MAFYDGYYGQLKEPVGVRREKQGKKGDFFWPVWVFIVHFSSDQAMLSLLKNMFDVYSGADSSVDGEESLFYTKCSGDGTDMVCRDHRIVKMLKKNSKIYPTYPQKDRAFSHGEGLARDPPGWLVRNEV